MNWRTDKFFNQINSLCPSGKSLRFYGNVSSEKFAGIENISVYRNIKSVLCITHPVLFRGALANVATLGGSRWTWRLRLTRAAEAYGKDVWS